MTASAAPAPSVALDRLLTRAAGTAVVVVGDVMLDEYVRGRVERRSPEAPVPVLRAEGTSSGLGGAANVARQLAAWRAAVDLVGVVGDDEAGAAVRAACAADHVGTAALVADPEALTTRKQRIVAGGHQLARVDWEDLRPFPSAAVPALRAALAALEPPAVVVVSDYGKGFLTDEVLAAVLDQAEQWGAPVLVDPSGTDLARYRGAALIKANLAEFAAGGGRARPDDPPTAIAAAAEALAAEVGVDELVVTLGERGLVAVAPPDPPTIASPAAREVFDVSGAGDTVMAVLALCRSWDEPLGAAARLANAAAGVAVARAGVAVVTPAEVVAASSRAPGAAVLARDDLAARMAAWRAEGRRVVLTNGCFDLLHHGHLHLLQQAAALGDVLVVALNSDRSVAALKGPERPVLPQEERVALVRGLSWVDAVVVFDEDDPGELIAEATPDVLVKGADYAPEDIVGGDAVRAAGGEVVTVALQEGWSTTALVERLRPRPGGTAG